MSTTVIMWTAVAVGTLVAFYGLSVSAYGLMLFLRRGLVPEDGHGGRNRD